jgi:prophage regulatory protein
MRRLRNGRAPTDAPNARQTIDGWRPPLVVPDGSEAPVVVQASYRSHREHGVNGQAQLSRRLIQPAESPGATDAPLEATASKSPHLFKRTVRRNQLRQMVPLADTTIYEMEQRGEFPRRFYLTPRCAAWDAAEIENWIEERRQASGARLINQVPRPDVRKRARRPVKR